MASKTTTNQKMKDRHEAAIQGVQEYIGYIHGLSFGRRFRYCWNVLFINIKHKKG